MNKIFDTHCHPYLNKDKDQQLVIDNFFENWWKFMIIIWTNILTSKKAIDLSIDNNWVFSTVWIHPCDVYDLDLEKSILQLENYILLNKNNIVWVWECWLDYYWLYKDEKINSLEEKYRIKIIDWKKKMQELFFKAQILLADKYDLPIIIHNRNSKEEVLRILKESNCKNFIFHCYSENLEYAEKLIEFSPECKISFSGIVTFNSAEEVQKTAKNIDIKHILAETDSPYLTPVPFRWKEENEPIFTKHVIEKINELKWIDCFDEIFNNSVDVFNIKKKI